MRRGGGAQLPWPSVAMWTCPHCGAPQAEAARCWVCRRSSTTCSTCRHFRASLSAEVGYCAKDRRRAPLSGLELRGCWEEGARHAPAPPDDGGVARSASKATPRGNGGPLDRPDPMRLRGFVPIDELTPPAAPEVPALPPQVLADAAEPWETRTSLFGDADG